MNKSGWPFKLVLLWLLGRFVVEIAPAIFNALTALATCRGDSKLAQTLVAQYWTSLPAERDALAQAYAVTPPDWQTIYKRVHRLQSGSGYLGAERIAAAARVLEDCILNQDSTDARTAAWRALGQALQDFLHVPLEEWYARLTVVKRP